MDSNVCIGKLDGRHFRLWYIFSLQRFAFCACRESRKEPFWLAGKCHSWDQNPLTFSASCRAVDAPDICCSWMFLCSSSYDKEQDIKNKNKYVSLVLIFFLWYIAVKCFFYTDWSKTREQLHAADDGRNDYEASQTFAELIVGFQTPTWCMSSVACDSLPWKSAQVFILRVILMTKPDFSQLMHGLMALNVLTCFKYWHVDHEIPEGPFPRSLSFC